ncbi:MAG: hypothetical protein IKR33_07645 [Bacteroidales bacterium]|nr:hypothetical protein [Bacteroidales bacterium]
MKHTVKFLALTAVLGLLAVGCHDDPVNPTSSTSIRNVGYIACGEMHSATVTGDDEWHALLDSFFEAVDGGCAVTFWNPDAIRAKQADTVTISTTDRQQAYRWGEEMYDRGYTVSIIYDSTAGVYNGTAIKSVAPLPDYEPIPLANYLPGTWMLDTTGPWHLNLSSRWYCEQWDSLPSTAYAWQEHISNYLGTWFDPSFYRQEVLHFTQDSVTAPYPNPWGWRSSTEYDSLGLFDSVMVFHYDIVNGFTINLETNHVYYNSQYPNIEVGGQKYIIQVNQDYMIVYGYYPRFYTDPTGISDCVFGFIRQ